MRRGPASGEGSVNSTKNISAIQPNRPISNVITESVSDFKAAITPSRNPSWRIGTIAKY